MCRTQRRAEAGRLVPQQLPGPLAREVPAAPIIALEASTLLQQAGGHRTLRRSVDSGEGVEQERHGVGAERRGVPAVEWTFRRRTRQVGADDQRVGIYEVQPAEHRKSLNQRPEGESPWLPRRVVQPNQALTPARYSMKAVE